MSRPVEPGLCARCAWQRVVASRRGARFWLCRRSATDPRYPRYPHLPVLRCAGFTPRSDGDAGGEEELEEVGERGPATP